MIPWRRRIAKARAKGAASAAPRSALTERRRAKLTLARLFQAPITDDEKPTESKSTEENHDDENSGRS